MTHEPSQPSEEEKPQKSAMTSGRELLTIVGVFALLVGGIFVFFRSGKEPALPETPVAVSPPATADPSLIESPPEVVREGLALPRVLFGTDVTNFWDVNRQVLYWWDEPVEAIKAASVETGDRSNIRKSDYAGAESCRECHPANYRNWSSHPHRFMNALATLDHVKGDFSGKASIAYLGGSGKFFKEEGGFRMALERDGVRRIFDISRTIGSRFFEYYVGRLIEGPTGVEDPRRTTDHVLPFGYWIDKQEWVPTVHVFRGEDADHEGWDPYASLKFTSYDKSCGDCHTTLPSGDRMIRGTGMDRITEYTPREVSFKFYDYLKEAHPEKLKDGPGFEAAKMEDVAAAMDTLTDYNIRENGVALGVSCEACHFGSKSHVEKSDAEASRELPAFFPMSPNLHVAGANLESTLGRNDLNRNYACAKCHSGPRPEFASGHHTWNSTEYADAVRGACYAPGEGSLQPPRSMTCVHCHDPHKATGAKWQLTPAQDDQKCLDCHQQFEPAADRQAHTHHPLESSGSRCMNCHMPKINEGLQDMVRTHRIFSPTEPRAIGANQPNACNLCHLDKPIDWTIDNLKKWYGDEHRFSEAALAANYPNREGAVGLGWMNSPHEATRLVAAEALAKARVPEALPALFNLLEKDPYLINRQFTQKNLDEWLNVKLKEEGYQFYMTEPERAATLKRIQSDENFKRRLSEAKGGAR
jgi:predicted CXXCH cytochrome family protein